MRQKHLSRNNVSSTKNNHPFCPNPAGWLGGSGRRGNDSLHHRQGSSSPAGLGQLTPRSRNAQKLVPPCWVASEWGFSLQPPHQPEKPLVCGRSPHRCPASPFHRAHHRMSSEPDRHFSFKALILHFPHVQRVLKMSMPGGSRLWCVQATDNQHAAPHSKCWGKAQLSVTLRPTPDGEGGHQQRQA